MPKVKPLVWSPVPQCEVLKRNIRVCMARSDMTAEKLSGLLKVSRQTIYNKLNEPQKMQFEELCRWAYIFNVDVAEFIKEGGV